MVRWRTRATEVTPEAIASNKRVEAGLAPPEGLPPARVGGGGASSRVEGSVREKDLGASNEDVCPAMSAQGQNCKSKDTGARWRTLGGRR